MKVPEVKQCCCGCSLETGTLTIACLNAISSLFTIIGYLQQLSQPPYKTEDFATKETLAIYRTLFLLLLLYSILGFVTAILLIVAVKKRIEIFFNTWLFFNSYNLISFIIAMFGVVIYWFYLSKPDIAGISLVSHLLITALGIYTLVIVNSCKLWVMNREMGSHET